jgi:predicted kinase
VAKLLVLRGLPASGKSTYARQLLADNPAGSVLRINNDELSLAMFGSAYGGGRNTAIFLGKLRAEMIRTAFRSGYGLVIVDNTNLNEVVVNGYRKLADELGADFELDDRFLSVPAYECLERNAKRENPVPSSVIIEMARLLQK